MTTERDNATTEAAPLGFEPIRLVDVELADEVPAITARLPDGRSCSRTRSLVRLHGRPLGVVELVVGPDGVTAAAHAAEVWSSLAREIQDHLARDGLAPVNTDSRTPKRVLVESVGLGSPRRHALAAAGALERFSTPVLGLRGGLLYREWLPDSSRVEPVDQGDQRSVATAIAAYVTKRRRALPVAEDVSLRLTGEHPAWEVASIALRACRACGALRTCDALRFPGVPRVQSGPIAVGGWRTSWPASRSTAAAGNKG